MADLIYKIGEPARDFSLPATDGKTYSLSDLTKGKSLVVIFTCNHCPYAQAYEARICKLAADYTAKGISFAAICSNDGVNYPEDDFPHMVEKSKQWGDIFPYLHDEKQMVAQAYDAACTPEVYVFDAGQKLIYHGCIDDNYKDPKLVKSHYLRDALDATLAGKIPAVTLTLAIGCSIKWKKP